MNILDLQYEFKTEWEFTGDNERDRNLLTVVRSGVDGLGKTITIVESYTMTRIAIEEMRLGLEAMLLSIREYMDD
jgi:hypothetical protein